MDFPLLQITTTTVTKVVTNVKYEKMDKYQSKLLKCRGLLLFFSFPQPKRKFKEIRITSHGGLFGSGGLFVKFGFRGGGLFESGGFIDHLR